MLQKVRKFIDTNRLLSPADRYLVALSGGADSVALLRILLSLGFDVEAVHCNFHLRGEESDRDESFCRELTATLGVKLHLAHFDTATFAKLHGISIEMAARDLRYTYFRQLLADLQMQAVCVAHHRDDSVETVLLNLVRGTGIEGLKGIAARSGEVVRPLLCVSREEIVGYLDSVGQTYVVDSTNLETDAQRNKVRLEILPMLEKLNPAVRQNIARMTDVVNDALCLVEESVERAKQDILSDRGEQTVVSIPALLETPAPETILWHILRERNFSSAVVTQLFNALPGRTGSMWSSPTHEALINRDTLVIVPKADDCDKVMRIPEPGKFVYDKAVKFSFSIVEIDKDYSVSRNPFCATLDADLVRFPLTIRTPQTSDRFQPFGMKGSKLVSDFLTDQKLSLFEKRRQLLVADDSGKILWLVGLRPDARVAITATTRRALVIQFSV